MCDGIILGALLLFLAVQHVSGGPQADSDPRHREKNKRLFQGDYPCRRSTVCLQLADLQWQGWVTKKCACEFGDDRPGIHSTHACPI